ncbi:MAG: hypothetical protein FRX48_09001 [Lasallia pustulata]|uniref:Uncharacterized protein n=1 Tax=Lasallia pustulata TaxID=136370 RepID=A0A5M8PD09_9LECA|nr:MAG: hypothetical protein FRX48_09001 [Lasallia pustulata]
MRHRRHRNFSELGSKDYAAVPASIEFAVLRLPWASRGWDIAGQSNFEVCYDASKERNGAHQVQEHMGTWRWIWRTGHGKIPSNGWQGGIRFRMAGAKGWSYRHLIGRTPRGLRPCAAKCTITGGVKKPDCVEITLDMSDDAKEQAHANIDRIPGILRLTRQRGRWTEDGAEYSHPRLLCLIFVDPDEGEVELFGLKHCANNKLDGPRGYPAPPCDDLSRHVRGYEPVVRLRGGAGGPVP